MFIYLNGNYKKNKVRLFSKMQRKEKRGNSHSHERDFSKVQGTIIDSDPFCSG